MQYAANDRNSDINILVHQASRDMSIAIVAFADTARLPDFDEMVANPALVVTQKITVDGDAILPYFSNLADAAPVEFNSSPFVATHTIPFDEIQARVALHILPHSIKISPDQLDPYEIQIDMFCNSQILSQKCPSEPSSEKNEASLLAMENYLFNHLLDSMKLQTRSICEILHHILEDHHFDLASNFNVNAEPM
jgi:hypothetical protein